MIIGNKPISGLSWREEWGIPEAPAAAEGAEHGWEKYMREHGADEYAISEIASLREQLAQAQRERDEWWELANTKGFELVQAESRAEQALAPHERGGEMSKAGER